MRSLFQDEGSSFYLHISQPMTLIHTNPILGTLDQPLGLFLRAAPLGNGSESVATFN